MNRDELCAMGCVFVENERYAIGRYDITEQELYFKAWDETFENTPVIDDEQMKRKSWEDMLSDTNKLELKIMDKLSQTYVGEVNLMQLNSEKPELGIQLLRKYQGQGIGTQIVKLFLKQLKIDMKADSLTLRIMSNNYISQKMFEKMGAIKIGEEGKEFMELMKRCMEELGKEKFEKSIKKDFQSTQRYIICYELPL